MKKQSNLSRLLDYAGTYRILSYLSWVLAAAGALLALVPFWYIWRILREVIEVAPNYENAVHVTHYGWMAVAFAFAAVLTYIAGLMCSHLAAFRIATNLRLAMTKHIATLPLGEIEQFGSGKLRRTISETTGATETYLAHQLPDKARAVATIAGLLTLLLAFDWRLGLLSLVPVALAFAVMTSMTGKGIRQHLSCHLRGVRCAPCEPCGKAAEDPALFLWEERPCRSDLLHHERLRRTGAKPVPFRCTPVRRDPLHHGHRRVAAVFQLAYGAGCHLAAACGVCHRRAGLRRAEKALPQSNGGKNHL